jgi:hypothetical protein
MHERSWQHICLVYWYTHAEVIKFLQIYKNKKKQKNSLSEHFHNPNSKILERDKNKNGGVKLVK